MSSANAQVLLDAADAGIAPAPVVHLHGVETRDNDNDLKGLKETDAGVMVNEQPDEGREPTEEEKITLRRVSGKVPWVAYVVCLVELAERAGYYGVSGVFNNFIQRPLPPGGNGAGAPPPGTQLNAGALGKGLQTATALTTLFSFLAFVTPMVGGIMADTRWGRYRTLWYGTAAGFVGHVLLVVAAIPSIIPSGNAIAPFILGLLVLAFATGFIKPTIAPLIADQAPIRKQQVATLKSGEKVIIDPGVTVENMLHLYYLAVNLGAFFSIATTYSAKRVGFWLAFLTPGIFYMMMPICLFWVHGRLTHYPPKGSETLQALKVGKVLLRKGGINRTIKGGPAFWDAAKPSSLAQTDPEKPVAWNDKFVDDLHTTFRACKVFIFFPIWYLADGGLNSLLTSMAGSMTTNGLPNDLLSNFNPIGTICAIPVYNYIVYPTCRRLKINFSPVRRIATGYLIGALLCAISAILQWRVYETSPCGYHATSCKVGTGVSPLSAWLVAIPYFLQPVGGVLISVTSYEMAYTMSPPHMKGLVIALVFLTSAISSAIVLIITPALKDPNLIWPHVGIGIACLLASILNIVFFDDLSKRRETDITITNEQSKALPAREQAARQN